MKGIKIICITIAVLVIILATGKDYASTLAQENNPPPPENAHFILEWSETVVRWNSSPGAAYYEVYYDSSPNSPCALGSQGIDYCAKLGANIAATEYRHGAPHSEIDRNHYWITACNSAGQCSPVEEGGPAEFRDTSPRPLNQDDTQFVWEDGKAGINWSPQPGATHYEIYHGKSPEADCRRENSVFCHLVDPEVRDTEYLHNRPNPGSIRPQTNNAYWISVCNSGGCSEVTAVIFKDNRPSESPSVTKTERNQSGIRIEWIPVTKAQYYRVYHDSYFSSRCDLEENGEPVLCKLIADRINGTEYLHRTPGEEENYYWITACNQAGCSDISHVEEEEQEKSESKSETKTPAPETPAPENVIEREEPIFHLQFSKTDVRTGESITANLAITNSLSQPEMTVKLIIQTPSGWSITGTGLAQSCVGQCEGTYKVSSQGGQQAIMLIMTPNEPGVFDVKAELEWYFGDDTKTTYRETESKTLYVSDVPNRLSQPQIRPTAPATPPEPEKPTPTPAATPTPRTPSGNGCGSGSKAVGDLALLSLLLVGLAGLRQPRGVPKPSRGKTKHPLSRKPLPLGQYLLRAQR